MTAVSEAVDTMAARRAHRLAAFASWAVLWLVFAAAAAILGCVAAAQGSNGS